MSWAGLVTGMKNLLVVKEHDPAVCLADYYNTLEGGILKREDLTENIWCFQPFQDGTGAVWFIADNRDRTGGQKPYQLILTSKMADSVTGMKRQILWQRGILSSIRNLHRKSEKIIDFDENS